MAKERERVANFEDVQWGKSRQKPGENIERLSNS